MMSITVLGCSASSPTPDRGLPSIAVQIGGDVLLLDCGEGTQRQMMRFGVSYSKVKAIFISHLHLDHFLGVFGLIETLRLNGREAPVELFGPQGSKSVFGQNPMLRVHELSHAQTSHAQKQPEIIFEIPGHEVFSFPVSHGPKAAAFGFVVQQKPYLRFHEAKAKKAGLKGPMFGEIQQKGSLQIGKKTVKLEGITYTQEGKKIAYSGDTVPCASLTHAAADCDLLIHEASFHSDLQKEADEKFHSTAAGAGLTAKQAGAKALLLTHISGRYADPAPLVQEAKKEFSGIVIAAKDGLKIEI